MKLNQLKFIVSQAILHDDGKTYINNQSAGCVTHEEQRKINMRRTTQEIACSWQQIHSYTISLLSTKRLS